MTRNRSSYLPSAPPPKKNHYKKIKKNEHLPDSTYFLAAGKMNRRKVWKYLIVARELKLHQ